MTAFDTFRDEAWPHEFAVTLHVDTLVGGVPSNPDTAGAWLRQRLSAASTEEAIQRAVAETMVQRGITAEEATKEVKSNRLLSGFKVHPSGELYIEGRQVKAMLREAASVALASGKLPSGNKWGVTRKGLVSFFAEHVMVVEDQILLGVKEPSEVRQATVHTWRGSSFKLEEMVHDVDVSFTIVTDHDFEERHWAMIMLTAEYQGLGASRSQGFGRFKVTRWEKTR